MIEIGVQVVDTDSIDTQALHQSSISHTHIAITQWIDTTSWIEARTSTRLVCDTQQLESISCDRIDKISALDLDSLNSERGFGAQREKRELDLKKILSATKA